MVDEKVRELISEINPEAVVFDNMSYDNSIIGMSSDGRVIYSYPRMVLELMKDEGWTEEEAVDWIDYNTMRSIPYIGGYSPIVMLNEEMFE